MIGAAAARFDPEVEAALLARYGLDPLDLAVTPRRLWNLLKHLPAGYTAAGSGAWSIESHLTASVIDAINQLLWVTVKINSRKGTTVPKPDPVQRPGQERDTPKKTSTLLDLATLLSNEGMVTDERA